MVEQLIDEYNRPAQAETAPGESAPPTTSTRSSAPGAMLADGPQVLPAARDYVAASLWRRVGLRINEQSCSTSAIGDPTSASHGKLHVRFGKGS